MSYCVSTLPSIVRINGKQIKYTSNPENFTVQNMDAVKVLVKPLNKTTRLFSIGLYTLSGTLLSVTRAHAASPSVWKEISPLFGVFQDISMVVGGLAVMIGLIVMIFKKKIGWAVINTAIVVVLGCFLVPSAVMLIAIIGGSLNTALEHAFEAFKHTQ